jgi:hypothetical protein
MKLPEEDHEIEVGFNGKPLKQAYFVTGKNHHVKFKVPVLQLNHQYHDDVPVAWAEYEVELEDGKVLRGHLDDSGQAEVRGMSSRPVRVRYGPDPTPYEIVDDGTNPAYIAHFTKSDADALTSGSKQGSQPPDAIAFGIEAVDWIWGTLKGGFNQKQTVSQIIVDAFIGMIPLVGEVTAVRDLVAIIFGMAQDPKRRESKLEWMTLVVLLFALIPVIGGAIKGVGKLLLKGGKEAAEASSHIKDLVAILNFPGRGDALKWLKELDFLGRTDQVLGIWHDVTHRLVEVLDSIQSHLKGTIPTWMLDYVGKLKPQIQALAQKGEAMIPDALKDLNERLKAAQRQLYQGEWHDIPKNLTSKTWETEARLVDVPGGKQWVVEKPAYPKNGKKAFVSRDGWPDLSDETQKYVEVDPVSKVATYKTISCFSGPMRPVKITQGKLYRVIEDPKWATGNWWVYALPESGVEWREGLAVLDSFSGNGKYVEMVIPEGGVLAWEGKAASQVENSEKAKKTAGQYLQGGQIQLFIDLKFGINAKAVKNISDPIETHWTGHKMLHVPTKEAQADYLNAYEFARKTRIAANTAEKSGRRNKNDKK